MFLWLKTLGHVGHGNFCFSPYTETADFWKFSRLLPTLDAWLKSASWKHTGTETTQGSGQTTSCTFRSIVKFSIRFDQLSRPILDTRTIRGIPYTLYHIPYTFGSSSSQPLKEEDRDWTRYWCVYTRRIIKSSLEVMFLNCLFRGKKKIGGKIIALIWLFIFFFEHEHITEHTENLLYTLFSMEGSRANQLVWEWII